MGKYALCVGINEYEPGSGFTKLSYAEADCNVLAELLERQYDFKVFLLTGQQATRSNIYQNLYRLGQLLQNNKDIFCFFFAGHGQSINGRYVLHAFEASANVDIESLALSDIMNVFRTRYHHGQIISIIDACHKEIQYGERGGNQLSDVTRDVKYVKQQQKGEKLIKSLLSCSEGEASYESKEFGHGVFTHYLLDILENKCHTLSFDMAIRELGRTVPFYVQKKYGVSQTPWFESPLFPSETWLTETPPTKSRTITHPEQDQSIIPTRIKTKYSVDDLKSSGMLEEYIDEGGKISGKEWFAFYEDINEKFAINSLQQLRELIEPIIKKGEYEKQRRKAEAARKAAKEQARKKAEQEFKEATKDMVLVEGGWFEMGSEDGEENEQPVHRVYVDGFYVDKYQVTNKKYAEFLNNYGSDMVKSGEYAGEKMINLHGWGMKKSGGNWQPESRYENHPVVYVTWYGANEYAKFYGKRLPTEAEWEYAARGGQQSKGYDYSGSDNLAEVAWSGEDYFTGSTHPVGHKRNNELGLYDMSGNANEWCLDWYGKDYYEYCPQHNPKGIVNGVSRIYRGGSWHFNPFNSLHVSARHYDQPYRGSFDLGFRCVRDLL